MELMVSECATSTASDIAARGGQRRRQANSGRQPERISLLQHWTSSHSELTTYHPMEIRQWAIEYTGWVYRWGGLPDPADRCRRFRGRGDSRTAWRELRWNGSGAVPAVPAKRGWWCCAGSPPMFWLLTDRYWRQPAQIARIVNLKSSCNYLRMLCRILWVKWGR